MNLLLTEKAILSTQSSTRAVQIYSFYLYTPPSSNIKSLHFWTWVQTTMFSLFVVFFTYILDSHSKLKRRKAQLIHNLCKVLPMEYLEVPLTTHKVCDFLWKDIQRLEKLIPDENDLLLWCYVVKRAQSKFWNYTLIIIRLHHKKLEI